MHKYSNDIPALLTAYNRQRLEESSKQKFAAGTAVKVADVLPRSMAHFRCGMVAIVKGSYAELCHSTDGYNSYELLFLNSEGRLTSSAWYDEEQLTAL